VSLANGGTVYFWPGWVAGPWGAVLLVRTLAGGRSRGPAWRPATAGRFRLSARRDV